VLLVDHQTGLISLQDFSPTSSRTTCWRWATSPSSLPTILTTSFDSGPNGPIVPELKEQFPDAPFIPVLARSTPGTTKISSRR
jgi:hypothetical protein